MRPFAGVPLVCKLYSKWFRSICGGEALKLVCNVRVTNMLIPCSQMNTDSLQFVNTSVFQAAQL